jgi:integrase
LEQHVFPILGERPVASIDSNTVLEVLTPIWAEIPETASRLRGRIEQALDFAAVKGWRDADNPARWKGRLALTLPSAKKVRRVQHRPSLPWPEMPAFMLALQRRQGMTALALRFCILTAARTGEARKMTWAEVDEATAVWTAPARHMKGKLVHFVPLAPAALAVLAEVKPLAAGRNGLVFPGQVSGRPLSDMALSMLMRGMATDGLAEGELPRWRDPDGRVAVPHGCRASFKGWARSHRWDDHLSELALAHVDDNETRAAYAREPLTEERRPMMEAWAALCTCQPATVASLDAARAARAGA